jgi:hypothetical protein
MTGAIQLNAVGGAIFDQFGRKSGHTKVASVHVRVMRHRRAPGVEHGRDGYGSAEAFGIVAHCLAIVY